MFQKQEIAKKHLTFPIAADSSWVQIGVDTQSCF